MSDIAIKVEGLGKRDRLGSFVLIRDIMVRLVPVFVFLLLVLPRLSWGLPSQERLQYYPNNPAILNESQDSRFYATSPIESEHPDEGAILNALRRMHPGQFDFNPHFFNYPSLHIYTVGAALEIFKTLGVVKIVNDKNFYFGHPEEMAKIYLVGRVITVLYGIAVLLLVSGITMLLTRNRAAAAVSAITLAVTPLWARDSAFLLVNVPAAALMTLTVYLSLKAYYQRHPWLLYVASISAGLAGGAKYPAGLIVIIPALIAIVNRGSNAKFREVSIIVVKHFVIAGLAFLVTTPYAVVSPREFLANTLFEAHDKLSAGGLLTSWTGLMFSAGPLLIVAFIGAWAYIAKWRRPVAAILGLWFLVGAGGALFSGMVLLRYWIPALPVMATTIGVGYSALQAGRYYKFSTIVLAVVLIYSAAYSIDLNLVSAQVDPRLKAAAWINESLPVGSNVATRRIYFDSPPFNADRFHLTWLLPNTCDAPPDAYLIRTEPLNGPHLCTGQRTVKAEFLNRFKVYPFQTLTNIPSDLNYTNMRIVVYSPTNF